VVRLSDLVERLGGDLRAVSGTPADPVVTDVHLDHRRVTGGELFAALPGTAVDGAHYAPAALERGAVAVLSPRELDVSGTNWVHPEARRVTGEAAALVHGSPTDELWTLGCTGTNGKSTVVHLVDQLLTHLGRRPGVIGTLGVRVAGGGLDAATHTTPGAPDLQRLAARHLAGGGDALLLEVSSHALDQRRTAGIDFDVAVFTCLGRDHLDYHGDAEAYAAAKERLFAGLRPGATAVVRVDDPEAERMLAAARRSGARVVTYGAGSRADLSAHHITPKGHGTELVVEGWGVPATTCFLPLIGRFNVENALAALAAVLTTDASPRDALAGLASVSPPAGRLEPVETGDRGFRVLVDYAHTPDALENVLGTLREVLPPAGRLHVVFGCGGDRDREKRGPMGAVVDRLADVAYVTSDNPRGEEPARIVEEVLAGFAGGATEVHADPDRRAAIRAALAGAREGDVVLIAGKGHETWQRFSHKSIPFDDRSVAREELP
jgi:UDP-N-acetylmuramoyl-L-alanyl-D-glutamate--2,6-diaminopimelate ligase